MGPTARKGRAPSPRPDVPPHPVCNERISGRTHLACMPYDASMLTGRHDEQTRALRSSRIEWHYRVEKQGHLQGLSRSPATKAWESGLSCYVETLRRP